MPCTIQLLCDKHEGLSLEAKGIKEHWWKPYMKKLFERRVCVKFQPFYITLIREITLVFSGFHSDTNIKTNSMKLRVGVVQHSINCWASGLSLEGISSCIP